MSDLTLFHKNEFRNRSKSGLIKFSDKTLHDWPIDATGITLTGVIFYYAHTNMVFIPKLLLNVQNFEVDFLKYNKFSNCAFFYIP